MDGEGTLYFNDGVIYEGEVNKGIIFGKGKYYWPDGSNYEGEIVDALRQGYGIFKNKVKGIEYKGNWKKGLRDGKGEIGYKSGAVYKGEFKNGKRHGFGVIYYPSGNIYQGQFKNGQKWGYGEMFWEDTKEVFRGFWENNKQNGYGEHLWLEKANKHKSLRNRYEGMFLNGMRHGIGCFFYSDGTRYEGEWVENRKEGFAFFTDSYGEKIEAVFKSDRIHKRLNKAREFKVVSSVDNNDEYFKTNNSTKTSEFLSRGNNKPSSKSRRVMVRSNKGSKTSFRINKKKSEKDSADKDADDHKSRGSSGKNTLKSFNKLSNLNKNNQELSESYRELIKSSQVNEITNPYVRLLRLDDLLERIQNKKEREKVLSMVEIVMMRYNTLLRSVFQACKFEPENQTERSFAVKMKIFWRFLRKAKVLTPNLTISQFNKMFFAQDFNEFKLRFQFEDLRKKIRDLKLKKYSRTLLKMRNSDGKFSSALNETEEEFTNLGSLGIGLRRIKEVREKEEMSNSKGRSRGFEGGGRTGKSNTFGAMKNSDQDNQLELNIHELSAVSDHEEDSVEARNEFYNTNYLLSLDPEEREFEFMRKNDVSFRNFFAELNLPTLDYRTVKDFYNDIMEPFKVPGPNKVENFQKSPFYDTMKEMDLRLVRAFSKDLMLDAYNRNIKKLKRLEKYVKDFEDEKERAYADAKKNSKKSKAKQKKVDEIIEINSPISEFPQPLKPIKFSVFDIHSGDNVMMFRNFIDALIRIIYVRENSSLYDFKQKIEKYIEFRIRPLIIENRDPEEIFGHQIKKRFKIEHVEEGENFVDRVFFDGYQKKKVKRKDTKNIDTMESKNVDSNSRASWMESGGTDNLSNTWNSARYSDFGKFDFERDKSNDSDSLIYKEKPEKKKKLKGTGKRVIERCKKILKFIFNKNLKNKFLTPQIEEYYGKIGEATKEMVMDCKSLIDLLQRANLVKDEDDKELLIQIVERHFDPDSSFTSVMDKCLKQQPYLFLNTQGSFGLTSFNRENLEEHYNPSSLTTSEGWRRTMTKGDDEALINIKINNRVSVIDIKKIGNEDDSFRKTEGDQFKSGRAHKTDRAPVRGKEFESDRKEMKSYDASPPPPIAMTKANENVRELMIEESASVHSREMDKRIKLFDKELAEALNRTLGSEILFFEFVEIFIIYCYSKVGLKF